MVPIMKTVNIENLKPGDLIWVKWYDASEFRGALLPEDSKYDMPVYVIGIYIGIKGRKRRHLIVAKEKLPQPSEWNADVIPIEMIESIHLIIPNFLQKIQRNLVKDLKKISVSGKPWYEHRIRVLTID